MQCISSSLHLRLLLAPYHLMRFIMFHRQMILHLLIFFSYCSCMSNYMIEDKYLARYVQLNTQTFILGVIGRGLHLYSSLGLVSYFVKFWCEGCLSIFCLLSSLRWSIGQAHLTLKIFTAVKSSKMKWNVVHYRISWFSSLFIYVGNDRVGVGGRSTCF